MRKGLVLEGGAMRGMYTAGVLDVFLENNIQLDLVVGVSAGALFGVNYLSGQRGRVIRYNKRFNPDKNYLGLRPLLREGNFINTRYAYVDVPHKLDPFDDEAYMASPANFWAVVTDVATGSPEYIPVTSVFRQMDVLRASGSMPFVSRPVELNGRQYLDGGISDSIPFRWMQKQGADKLVMILTRDETYRKKPMSAAMVRLARICHSPAISRQLAHRHSRYNRAVAEAETLAQQGSAFLIRPSRPLDIRTTERDPEKLQEIYDLGTSDARACLEALKEYLEK